jgi:hypothetical protein
MSRLCFLLIALAAAPAAPSVVDLYNLVHPDRQVKKSGSAWAVQSDGHVPTTVDIPNGYLTFGDPAGEGATAALYVPRDKRRLLADYQRTGPAAELTFREYKDGAVAKMAASPLPPLPTDLFLLPSANKKLVASSPDLLGGGIPLAFELPRVGTTLVVAPALEALRMSIGLSRHSETHKDDLYRLLETGFYAKIELKFDEKTGTFSVGKKVEAKAK